MRCYLQLLFQGPCKLAEKEWSFFHWMICSIFWSTALSLLLIAYSSWYGRFCKWFFFNLNRNNWTVAYWIQDNMCFLTLEQPWFLIFSALKSRRGNIIGIIQFESKFSERKEHSNFQCSSNGFLHASCRFGCLFNNGYFLWDHKWQCETEQALGQVSIWYQLLWNL